MDFARRKKAVLASGALAAALLGLSPAVAQAAPARQQAVPACDENAIEQAYESWMGSLSTGNPPRQDGDVWYWRLDRANLYCKVGVTGPHWVQGDIRATYLREGEYQRFGVPENNESDAAYGGKHNIFVDGPNGTSGIYWKSDLGARSIAGPIFDKWAAAGFEWNDPGSYGYPTSSTLTKSDGVLFNEFLNWDGAGATLVQREGTVHDVRGAIRSRWLATGAEDWCGYPTSDETAVPGGAVSRFQHGQITWNARTNTATEQCDPSS